MKKNNYIKFHFTLLVITLIAYSFTAVYATPNDEDSSPTVSHKPSTNSISTDKPLDIFYKEGLDKRGFAIKTQRTVIIPVTSLVSADIEDMYRDKATEFLPEMKAFASAQSFERAEHDAQLQAYENMNLEDKRRLKIYDCAVIMWDEELQSLNFAGVYSILPPDSEGWSESRFILIQQYRNMKLGEEVKKAIYEGIAKDLIGKTVKVIKYETDPDNSNALFIRHSQYLNKVIPNKLAKAYLEDSNVTFKGLQGWVHEDNIASIKLNQKCGWIECGSKEMLDLKGVMRKHFLYRSPSL
jgi:hypothetical protein